MGHLRLYSNSTLPCPQRVLVVAAEKGIDLEIVHIDIFADQIKLPEFTKRQPFGAIPVLLDTSDGSEFVLYESRAICRYLAMISKDGPRLIPDASDTRAVARFEQAASIELTSFDPFANRLVFEKYFKPRFGDESTDIKLIDYLSTNLAAKLDIIDKILGQQNYMAGQEFSLADIFYMPYMSKLVEIGKEAIFTNRPHVESWWNKISSRPSYKQVFCSEAPN